MFKHLKSSFEDTKKSLQKELTSSFIEQDEATGPTNLSFKSAERVYNFMLDVIQTLVSDRGLLA